MAQTARNHHFDGDQKEEMAAWKRLAIQIIPVVLTVVVSITGAYIALNSQVSGLSVEVGRLTKVVDSLSIDNQASRGLVTEVAKLTVSVDTLKDAMVKSAVQEKVVEQTSAKVGKLESDMGVILTVLGDLRITGKVLEREVENLRQDVKRIRK
jgi:transaldolase